MQFITDIAEFILWIMNYDKFILCGIFVVFMLFCFLVIKRENKRRAESGKYVTPEERYDAWIWRQ